MFRLFIISLYDGEVYFSEKTFYYMGNLSILSGYTKENWDEDYFYLASNNNYYGKYVYLDKKMLDRNITWTTNQADLEKKLGECNFYTENGGYDKRWIFEMDGDTFYFSHHEHEGTYVGIWAKKADLSKNWAFEPIDFTLGEDDETGKKLVKFEEELIKLIK